MTTGTLKLVNHGYILSILLPSYPERGTRLLISMTHSIVFALVEFQGRSGIFFETVLLEVFILEKHQLKASANALENSNEMGL